MSSSMGKILHRYYMYKAAPYGNYSLILAISTMSYQRFHFKQRCMKILIAALDNYPEIIMISSNVLQETEENILLIMLPLLLKLSKCS